MAYVDDVKCDFCEEDYQVHDGHSGWDCVCPKCGLTPGPDTRLIAEAEDILSTLTNLYLIEDDDLDSRIDKWLTEVGLRRDGTHAEQRKD
jgi:hypothetical protein